MQTETEPRWEKVAAEYCDHPVDVEGEVRELVGRCFWDVFSDEHDFVAKEVVTVREILRRLTDLTDLTERLQKEFDWRLC